jgi:integrase
MPLPLIKILHEHKERQAQLKTFTDDYRICGGEKIIRSTTVDNKNKMYATMAGLKIIRIHDFRHSHVALLVNKRVIIQEISRRLGHKEITETLNTYSHLYPKEEERKVMEILNMIS